jgi:ubiquinone biosynthesis protein COQ9
MSDLPEKPKKPRPRATAPKAGAQNDKATAKAGAPKDKAPAPKPDAKAGTPRSDDDLRDAVLDAALPHAAFDGFTDMVLQKAGAEAGLVKADVARLFEDGPIGLVEYFSVRTDAEMERRLAEMDLKAMKIRARIATAVKTRLAILKPHKEAARRAAALLSLPMHAALGARLVYRTVDAMWRAAGDTSTDFNFYTKRGILAGVYGSTAMRWFNDTSEDEKATEQFLADRIENVMQFEKFKAKAKEALSNFPMFADWAKPKAK